MSKIRHQRIAQKFAEEQAHIQYLLQQGWHPLDIADQMMHHLLELLRESIFQQHPEWTEDQIIQEMRRRVKSNKKRRHTKE